MDPTQKEILDRLTALEVKMDSTELHLFNKLDHLATILQLHAAHLEGFFGSAALNIENLSSSDFVRFTSSFPHAQYFRFVFSTRESLRILTHELSELRLQLSRDKYVTKYLMKHQNIGHRIQVYRKGEKDAERADLLDR
jgi:hypothetical protein